ncbi:TlpA disulfide reductase family protein [Bdellovibrionota bacterium FG-1]
MTTPVTTPGNHGVNSLIKVLLPIGMIIVLVVGGLYWVKAQVAHKQVALQNAAASSGTVVEEVQIEVGQTLPDVDLHVFGGDKVKLSGLSSRVTLVNFWATWCEACMLEMPSIVKLRKSFLAQGFDVAAVNVDHNPGAVLPRVMNRLGIDFRVFFDEDQKLSELFHIEAIPLTVIINTTRKILMVENGERDWNGADMHAAVEKWLAE